MNYEIIAGKCPIEVGGDCPLIPKGEWILQYRNLNGEFYTCSQCERMILVEPEQSLSDYPFCHCGADMRKGGKE